KDAVADLDESGSDSRFASRALKVLLERIVGVVRRDKNIVKAGWTERRHGRGRQLSLRMVVSVEETPERLNLLLQQIMLEVGKGVSPVLKLDGMSSQKRCIQKHTTAHAIGKQQRTQRGRINWNVYPRMGGQITAQTGVIRAAIHWRSNDVRIISGAARGKRRTGQNKIANSSGKGTAHVSRRSDTDVQQINYTCRGDVAIRAQQRIHVVVINAGY